MSWYNRVFTAIGVVDEAVSEAVADAPAPAVSRETKRERRAKKKQADELTPLGLATTFARAVPGAVVEDFGATPREDGTLARVTYQHQGAVARVVFYRYDESTFTVWLEVKCTGTFGAFNVVRADAADADEDRAVDEDSADDADDATPKREPRFFLTRSCYVSGERLRNEVARIRLLPQSTQDRLVDAARKVELINLGEEVLSARIGGILHFAHLLESQSGASFVLTLGSELAFLAKQFPPIPKEVAELAEARTCRFCAASFVFSPRSPTCTRCGAPADAADPMPELAPKEIPDDPIDADVVDNPEYLDEKMEAIRSLVRALMPLVDHSQVREDRERARIYVEYMLDGRSFRVKIMEESAGIRIEVPGVLGQFNLGWGEGDLGGEKDPGSVWRESQRKVFFSRHLRVGSPRTTREAARLASLPSEALALLTRIGEEHRHGVQLENGYLSLGLGHAVHERGVELIVGHSRDLAKLADAFPRDFSEEEDLRCGLRACAHCGWAFFGGAAQQSCCHCGATPT